MPASPSPSPILLTDDELQRLTPAEASEYVRLLEEQAALTSPLDLAELMFPETRRWPHLLLLNDYLVALSEYRLTAQGPVPHTRVDWWFVPANGGDKVYVPGPHDIPEVVADYGADTPLGPVVFRFAISMRPRAGKSRLVTEVLPFWLQLQAGNTLQIGVGTYSDSFAADWGGQARDFAMQYHDAHPWFPPPAGGYRGARDVFDLREGGKIRYVGVGGGITGKTLNILIGDDFIKNDQDAQSEATRLASHRFYDRTWKTRKTRDLRPNARFPFPIEIIMATRWHQDDVLGHAVFDPETNDVRNDWCYLNIPALATDPDTDPLRRQAGEAHPNAAGETRADMERLREDDPRGFEALYQGQPSPEEGGLIPTTFGTSWWTRGDGPERHMCFQHEGEGDGGAVSLVTVPAEELVYFTSLDMAATEKSSSDWTVAFACAYSREFDALFLLDRYRARITTDKYISELMPFILSHSLAPPDVIVENITYGQTFAQQVRAYARSNGVRVSVRDDVPFRTDKVSRALTSGLPSLVRQGKVFILQHSPWREELISEAGLFPFGTFDDQVDALTFAAWYVSEIPEFTGRRRKPEKTLPEIIDEQVDKAQRKNARRSRNRNSFDLMARRQWR